MDLPDPTHLPASPAFADGARLLADIGGTNARFALEVAPHRFEAVEVLACDAYPTFQAAVFAYLSGHAARAVCKQPLRHGAVAIANPVEGDMVKMTNHHWLFSIEAVRQELGLATLAVVNDFTALAMALPHLGEHQRIKVGGGSGQAGKPIGLIGPGTGLGVSGIIPAGAGHWIPLASEGGHVTFSPADALDLDILRHAWSEYEHVSAERLLSGPGLELIYRALAAHAGKPAEPLAAAEISRRASDASCPICLEAVARFCAMLGTVAGNLAVTLGATGGMYIGGGIVPRLGSLFTGSAFRARFEAKGRFVHYLGNIPTYVITEEYPAFLGASAILAERLAA